MSRLRVVPVRLELHEPRSGGHGSECTEKVTGPRHDNALVRN